MNHAEIFEEGVRKLNIIIDHKQIDKFMKYYEILIEKNKVMNLTTITEEKEVINKHFIDSLSLVRVCNLNKKFSLTDVGTGAGFPGIPLKIVFPEIEILLIDSLNKRVNFLNEVIEELELKNIIAVHGRAEDYGRDKCYREKYDICVSRAVANLSSLAEYCMPFVKNGGQFIPYKAGNISAELEESKKAIYVLGGKIDIKDTFVLPYTDIERTLVVINKIRPTPSQYPRSAGKPSKDPIK